MDDDLDTLLIDAGPATRQMAVAAGNPTYFSGKPCPIGHVAPRYVANWSCVVCCRDKVMVWRGRNSEKLKADKARWFFENMHRSRQATVRWRSANPDLVRVYDQRKKAKRRQAEGSFDADDIRRIRSQQRNRCAHPWCRTSLDQGYHVDHIKALARGGSNWPRNLQLLCKRCNQQKHARDALDVARQHGMLV